MEGILFLLLLLLLLEMRPYIFFFYFILLKRELATFKPSPRDLDLGSVSPTEYEICEYVQRAPIFLPLETLLLEFKRASAL